MRQVETSRTLVFDAPRRARAFFEALVADNLDIGRPGAQRADLQTRSTPGGKTVKNNPASWCAPRGQRLRPP
jgi:hypothetical protein